MLPAEINSDGNYILHLLSDEKFTDHVIQIFEEIYPSRNIYYIELNSGFKEFKYVKSSNSGIIIAGFGAPAIESQLPDLSVFSAVIFHNIINQYKIEFLANRKEKLKYHWMIWGADLYSFPGLSRNILPISMEYLKRNSTFIKNWARFIYDNYPYVYNILYIITHFKKSPIHRTLSYCKKFASISTIISPEIDLVKKWINPNVVDVPFIYSTIEKLVAGDLNSLCNGDNFLLGNSATIENNHLDAFSIISKSDINKELLFCPLSYGGPGFKNYARDITLAGKNIFGDRFIPLTEFLSNDEYVEIIEKCGNVIMNHLRQQALGNIITSMWKGARVYFNELSPVYSYYKSLGLTVYTLSDIHNFRNLPDYESLAKANRSILYDMYSEQIVKKEAIELVDFLLK